MANPYEDNTAIAENYPTCGTIGDWLTTVTNTNPWDDVVNKYHF